MLTVSVSVPQVVRSKHKVRSFAYCPARRKGTLVQLAVALTNNSFEVRTLHLTAAMQQASPLPAKVIAATSCLLVLQKHHSLEVD